jgi:ferritin-like metal-binding protein YciE
MAEMNERDEKLVQYLSEAYGKERELETALQAHISMTTKPQYRKRLQQHLRETKAHAKAVERRIKKLGGGGQTMQSLVGKATAAAKGPLHMVRGGGEQEKMLKNAKTEYWNEHEEIATYLAIETLAEKVGDRETAKLARGIRREEERMARFLEAQVKSLSGAVAIAEVPREQRSSKRKRARKRAKAGGGKARKSSGGKSRKSSGGSRAAKSKGGRRSVKAKGARKPARSSRR